MWTELEDTKEKLEEAEDIIKIWKKYKIFSRHLSKAILGEETSVWKTSYKKLLKIRIRTPLADDKKKIADKIDRLVQVC
jgi:hypothetical protein